MEQFGQGKIKNLVPLFFRRQFGQAPQGRLHLLFGLLGRLIDFFFLPGLSVRIGLVFRAKIEFLRQGAEEDRFERLLGLFQNRPLLAELIEPRQGRERALFDGKRREKNRGRPPGHLFLEAEVPRPQPDRAGAVLFDGAGEEVRLELVEAPLFAVGGALGRVEILFQIGDLAEDLGEAVHPGHIGQPGALAARAVLQDDRLGVVGTGVVADLVRELHKGLVALGRKGVPGQQRQAVGPRAGPVDSALVLFVRSPAVAGEEQSAPIAAKGEDLPEQGGESRAEAAVEGGDGSEFFGVEPMGVQQTAGDHLGRKQVQGGLVYVAADHADPARGDLLAQKRHHLGGLFLQPGGLAGRQHQVGRLAAAPPPRQHRAEGVETLAVEPG